jgi:hypothetical protein
VRKRPVHCKKIQASGGPVTDKALEEIIFRAAHGVVQSLAPYPGQQQVAMLPSVVRMLLATFIERWRDQPAAPRTRQKSDERGSRRSSPPEW